MRENIRRYCETFIEDKQVIKSVFGWDSSLVQLACAGIFLGNDQRAEESKLRQCKEMLTERVGVFSNFRSYAKAPIVAMLAVSEHPEELLERGMHVYELLKSKFWSSTYLPLAAMVIAQNVEPAEYEQITERIRAIYDEMKSNHPFLTSSEDSAFCALMALSEKSNEALIQDAEDCYSELKGYFFSSNAVQSLSHVLALCDGQSKVKCAHTMELFTTLHEKGYKYGTSYELPTLGVLAMSGGNLEEISNSIIEIDRWLSEQKGFGFFSSVSKKQRLMYAGIIAQKEYLPNQTLQTAAVNSSVSILVAQQAAMCAAVAASAAASANGSSH